VRHREIFIGWIEAPTDQQVGAVPQSDGEPSSGYCPPASPPMPLNPINPACRGCVCAFDRIFTYPG
jgi:hypothetical protein